jgi:uncharacterized surface protein with fasciclin (FAS1) repeats
MRTSRRVAAAAAGSALAVVASVAVTASAATAASTTATTTTTAMSATTTAASHHRCHHLGTRSLAQVLLADKSGFDKNGKDFDILTAAVKAVLAAKPTSAVGVLANGKVALTAFIPTDTAFRRLVRDLTGKSPAKEQDVFKAVASLGIPTVEKVLLYHVVPGRTITAKQASHSNGAWLKTAEGAHIKVRVVHGRIYLQDKDPNSRNPRVVAGDINKGNRQIAHAINRVLRPVDLPPVASH